MQKEAWGLPALTPGEPAFEQDSGPKRGIDRTERDRKKVEKKEKMALQENLTRKGR